MKQSAKLPPPKDPTDSNICCTAVNVETDWENSLGVLKCLHDTLATSIYIWLYSIFSGKYEKLLMDKTLRQQWSNML